MALVRTATSAVSSYLYMATGSCNTEELRSLMTRWLARTQLPQ